MHWFFPKPVKTNVVGGPLRNISFFLVPRKWNRRKKLHRSCQGTIFQGYASGRVVFLGSVPGCNVNWSRYFLRYLKWTSFMKSMYIVYSMRGLCVCVCVFVFVENPSGGLLWKPHVGKIGLVFSSILVANWHFMIRPGFLEKPSSPHKGS